MTASLSTFLSFFFAVSALILVFVFGGDLFLAQPVVLIEIVLVLILLLVIAGHSLVFS